MTKEQFFEKVYPIIKLLVSNLHERIGLRITCTQSYSSDISGLLYQADQDLMGLAKTFYIGNIIDSHSGQLREGEEAIGVTLEIVQTLRIIFLLELVRQSSEIHTGRGKMQDTQYAECKELIQEYFKRFKGNPDSTVNLIV